MMVHVPSRLRMRLRDPKRRGVIFALGCFLLIASFAFAAFAIDLGFIVLTGQQLQNAADAAALAGVLELKTATAGITISQLKQLAFDEATVAARANRAATRPVELIEANVLFGNRTYDVESAQFQTEYEGLAGSDLPNVNVIEVNIAYDESGGPRKRLDLFFARVIGVQDAVVSGTARAMLTPRDLVFVIDISGSMFGDSGGNTAGYPAPQANRQLLGPIYGDAVDSWPSKQYAYTDTTYFDEASKLPQYEAIYNDAISAGAFGTNEQKNAFFAQEFPASEFYGGLDPTKPWQHWKWQAFCDYAYCTAGGGFNTSPSANIYKGENGQPRNKNVVMSATRTSITGNAIIGPANYGMFCLWNGYIPCVRGQQAYSRDYDSDDSLDLPVNWSDFPSLGSASPQPEYIGYYPRPKDIPNFNADLVNADGSYPNAIQLQPMATVREVTVRAVRSMIESERNFDRNVVFNQVGLVGFGTLAHVDLDLSNDLQTALRAASSRLNTTPGNPLIEPNGGGATNIGMGIRKAIEVMTSPTGRGRPYASKVIALLTDGQPNYSPQNSPNGFEFSGQTPTIHFGTGQGESYAQYWAEEAGKQGIAMHVIGIGRGVNAGYLRGLADLGNGAFVHITDPVGQRSELDAIFQAIAKDKLGKLYLE